MLKYYLSQIDTISKKISLSLSKTDCIFLYGELGSGKTTFVRSLVHQLQKKNRIKKTEVVSPTFSLLHEYEIKNLKVMTCFIILWRCIQSLILLFMTRRFI